MSASPYRRSCQTTLSFSHHSHFSDKGPVLRALHRGKMTTEKLMSAAKRSLPLSINTFFSPPHVNDLFIWGSWGTVCYFSQISVENLRIHNKDIMKGGPVFTSIQWRGAKGRDPGGFEKASDNSWNPGWDVWKATARAWASAAATRITHFKDTHFHYATCSPMIKRVLLSLIDLFLSLTLISTNPPHMHKTTNNKHTTSSSTTTTV